MAVDHRVHAESDGRGDQEQAEDANRVTRPGEPALLRPLHRGVLPLVALYPQQQGHPHHRGEQDELLADRVEAPVVEDDRVDDVRGVPFRHRLLLQDGAVRPPVAAEPGDPPEPPREHRRDPERPNGEDDEPGPPAHRSRSRIFANVSRIITG